MRSIESSFGILSTIGNHADVFIGIEGEVKKAAFDLLKKSLKIQKADADYLRLIHGAIGGDNFVKVLDLLNEKEISALMKKADPHLAGLTNMKAHELRVHLRELATSKVEPTSKPVVPKRDAAAKGGSKKAPAHKSSKPAVPMYPESMSAKGSRHRNAS